MPKAALVLALVSCYLPLGEQGQGGTHEDVTKTVRLLTTVLGCAYLTDLLTLPSLILGSPVCPIKKTTDQQLEDD